MRTSAPPPSAQRVLEIYASPAIGTKEIMEVFSCSTTTAVAKKKPVFEKMKELGIMKWKEGYVCPQVAFEVWGIDISGIEARFKKLMRLRITQKERDDGI